MLKNKILVLAGISSLYDIRSIKEYFEQIGIQTLFIESILMSKYVDEEVEYLACDSFELAKNEDYLFIPLNDVCL